MFFLSIIFKQACYSAFDLHYLWTCSPKILTFGKAEEKMLFLLLFAHLIVSLKLCFFDRLHLGNKRKTTFLFVFLSVCTIFGLAAPRYSHSAKQKKKCFFFCLSLT